MVADVQTFGELSHWHPHVHAVASDGVFTPDGTFIALPTLAVEPFLKLWREPRCGNATHVGGHDEKSLRS